MCNILLYFERFYVIEKFQFYKISLFFLASIFKTSKIYKHKF